MANGMRGLVFEIGGYLRAGGYGAKQCMHFGCGRILRSHISLHVAICCTKKAGPPIMAVVFGLIFCNIILLPIYIRNNRHDGSL